MIRRFFSLFAIIALTTSPALASKDYAKIDTKIPHALDLKDHNGKKVSFESLKGEKGLVIIFVRSADWCPYCKNQMRDFGKNYKNFKKLGYEVVSISYDSVSKLSQFAKASKIPYKMLSDTTSQSIIAFGLLNEKYKKGSRFYGIPNPAVYVINAEGVITHMFQEDGYQTRPPIGGMLRAIE